MRRRLLALAFVMTLFAAPAHAQAPEGVIGDPVILYRAVVPGVAAE